MERDYLIEVGKRGGGWRSFWQSDIPWCFESTGTELGVGDVMAMLPGISKRTAQKRLKALFEKGEVARRKEGGAFVYFKE